jgi:hypothetical protein
MHAIDIVTGEPQNLWQTQHIGRAGKRLAISASFDLEFQHIFRREMLFQIQVHRRALIPRLQDVVVIVSFNF